MKHTLILWTLSVLAAQGTQAADPMGAELDVTRVAIRQALERLDTNRPAPHVTSPDYLAKAKKFQARTRKALAEFERFLSDPHQGLFPRRRARSAGTTGSTAPISTAPLLNSRY